MKLGERHRFWFLMILVVVIFIAYSALGEKGFIRLNAMGLERDGLRSRVEDLEKKNRELAEEIGLLRDDPATIEALARTELGLVREGETVYVLPPGQGSDPK